MVTIANFRAGQYPAVTGTRCVKVYIPDDDAYLSLLAGLLNLPASELNWQGDEDDIAATAQSWRDAYVQTDWGQCNSMGIPVGAIMQFGAVAAPSGWLICDGALVAKAAYPALWGVLGDWWGTPTETHFYLPDMRNRSPMGYDTGIPPKFPFASQQGEFEHTLTVEELASHDHVTYPTAAGSDWNVISAGTLGVDAASPNSTVHTWETGGDEPHNNLHPVAVCTFIIYTGG